MHIVSALFENFKRIEVIEIDAAGEVVEITGKNEQGKSSLLDAIESALGGKRHDPAEPIRRGAEGARVVLNLGDLVVERRWTQASDRLVVKNADGAAYPKAQAKLDELVGGLAFDPLAFMSESAARRREILLGFAGLDLDEIETRRARAYDARREAGRWLRSAEAQLEGAPEPADGTPDEEIDVSAVAAQMREAMAECEANDAKRRQAEAARGHADSLAKAHQNALDEIERLQEELRDAQEDARGLAEKKTKAKATANRLSDATDKLEDPDLDEVQSRIDRAAAINAEVRKGIRREALASEFRRAQQAHAKQEAALAAVDAEKAEALASAKLPVEGLEITDDGVSFEGLPLEQAAMSRRVRICTAIGAALNPRLKIALIRHGNDFDADTLASFYETCKAEGLQPWVERIEGITDDAMVIEAGRRAAR